MNSLLIKIPEIKSSPFSSFTYWNGLKDVLQLPVTFTMRWDTCTVLTVQRKEYCRTKCHFPRWFIWSCDFLEKKTHISSFWPSAGLGSVFFPLNRLSIPSEWNSAKTLTLLNQITFSSHLVLSSSHCIYFTKKVKWLFFSLSSWRWDDDSFGFSYGVWCRI